MGSGMRNRILRKSLAVVLAISMVLSVTACGSGNSAQEAEENVSESAPEDTAQDAAETEEPAEPDSTEAADPTASGENYSKEAIAANNGESITVGFVLSDFSAPVFVQAQRELEKRVEADGNKLTCVDCQGDVNALINGVENLTNAGAKIIIIQNFAGDAAEPILQQAQDKGIIICSYDNLLEFANYSCLADNEELGRIIGSECGKWIAETYGDEAVDVAVCNYPSMEIMITREKGMLAGLAETAPNAKVVNTLSAGFVPEGVTAGENFLQANPDVKAVMGINDGGVLGVYQAYKSAGKSKDDGIGMFGSDGSSDAAAAIKEEDMFKCTINLKLVDVIIGLYDDGLYSIAKGEDDASKKITYFPMIPTYLDNVDEIRQ